MFPPGLTYREGGQGWQSASGYECRDRSHPAVENPAPRDNYDSFTRFFWEDKRFVEFAEQLLLTTLGLQGAQAHFREPPAVRCSN
jgi:hypothetical protein